MKTFALTVGLILLQPLTALLAADSPTRPPEKRIDMVAVSEHSKRNAELARSTPSTGSTYSLYDSGYVETGDPIAGERPPAADVVANQLTHALQQAGFQPTSGGDPAYNLVYSWGLIRPRTRRDISFTKIDPNLRQRLSLVATTRTVNDLEQEILTRRATPISSSLFFDRPSWRDALDLAQDSLYFITVTAYDGRNPDRSQPLWRTSLSAQSTSAAMERAIPALAAGAGPYLGKSFDRPQTVHATLLARPEGSVAASSKNSGDVIAPAGSPAIQALVKKEHDRAMAEYGPANDQNETW